MDSWRALHPDWEYTLYDNKFLESFDFATRAQINEYLKRGVYTGVADLMRLEILYEFGGLMPGADSICLRNTDELFERTCAYTVYENEFIRGKLVSPIQAAEPRNKFVGQLIERLRKTKAEDLDEPWVSTGNLFTALMIAELTPDVVVFPSHYLIPIHYTGLCYEGNGPVYAVQKFGSTVTPGKDGGYHKHSFLERLVGLPKRIASGRYNAARSAVGRTERIQRATARYLGLTHED